MSATRLTSRNRRLLVHGLLFAPAMLTLIAALQLAARAGSLLQFSHDISAILFTVVSAVLFLSMLLCSYESRCKLAALAISSIVSLYAVEIGTRLLAPAHPPREIRNARMAYRAQLAQKAGLPFDTRSLLEVIVDRRRSDTHVLPSGNFETYLRENIVTDDWYRYERNESGFKRSVICIGGQEVLPLGQPAQQLCVGTENENGYYVVFETDEHGFRNPRGLWSKAEIDIVGLGDSFTEGAEVRDGESFMSQVQVLYPNTINLGVGGGGPMTMLACLREYGQQLKPKIVLWCFYEGNDLINLSTRMQTPILKQYLQRGYRQKLLQRQAQLDEAIRDFLEAAVQEQLLESQAWQERNSNFIREGWHSFKEALASTIVLEQICTKLNLRPGAELLNVALPHEDLVGDIEWATGIEHLPEPTAALFSRILGMAKAEVESWNGKLYFVYLPSFDRVADPHFKTDSHDWGPRSKVLSAVRELEIDVIDLVDDFVRHDDPLSLFPFGLYGHYAPSGHQVVATKIVRRLENDAFLAESSER